MIIQVYNDATDKLDLRAEANDFTRGGKTFCKTFFLSRDGPEKLQKQGRDENTQKGMKIRKKTTLPWNDGKKERQKDYPYLHMRQV